MAPPPSAAQSPERKIAEMELLLLGISATIEPVNPVIPKNTDAGVRIVVRSAAYNTSVWTELRVPAGGTVRQMQFLLSVPDGPTSVEDARALARSLADLTEPTALCGLGAAERATILNFGGPGSP
jgi:hypothetical protein